MTGNPYYNIPLIINSLGNGIQQGKPKGCWATTVLIYRNAALVNNHPLMDIFGSISG